MRLLLLGLLLCGALWAQSYKAVYDLSSEDMRYLLNRVALIEKTASMIREQGNTPEFVVTIHSGATPILSKYPELYADEGDAASIAAIQKRLKRLVDDYGAEVLGCDLAIGAYGIDADEVVPFADRTPNSIIDLIKLQNDGYAVVYFVR